MAIKFDTIDGVPSWAVCGFEYGDWSGVEDSDQAAAARCRSLAGEFPFECFAVRKIEEGGAR